MIQRECDFIIKAAWVLANDQTQSIFEQGAVAVEKGRIAAAGEASAVAQEWQPRETVELGEALLMPGLINAHTHVPMTFLRGFADDLPLMELLTKHIFPVEAQLTREIVSLGARLGMYEMMRTGTTAFVDSYLLEEEVFKAAGQTGMRCCGGEVIFAFPSRTYADWDGARQLCRDHAARYPSGGRVQTALMPHSVYTTNDHILRECIALAEELDVMLHIHLSESSGEVAQSMDLHNGRRPIEYARDMGLLNQRTILAHMVEMTEDELETVGKSGAGIIHNPVSNLKLASGLAPVSGMIKHGISVGLGTDGACSNNTLDMFETMKLAAILAKGRELDATAIPASQALDMATVQSGRIFRLPGLGTLAPGAPADIIALDLTGPNMCPMFNPVSHAVYAASGKDCVFTMVDGRILYRQGRYLDGCFDDTRAAAADLVNWVKRKSAN